VADLPSQTEIRILAAGDIHGVTDVYDWLGQMVRRHTADLLILAGDLFTLGSEQEQREQSKQIIPLLKRAEVPCFYLMGNDDSVGLDYTDGQIKPLHGRCLTLRGRRFVGYEYTPPFIGDAFVKTENEIEKDLRSIERLLDNRCIFVTHAPAKGVLDRTYLGERVGSPSVAALLDRKPVLAHIHGHIHESFGHEANHFNVASAGHKRAFLIGIPSLEHLMLQGE